MELTHDQMWKKCLDIIESNLLPEQFDAWFKPIRFVSFADGVVTLYVPSAYFSEQLEENYLQLLGPVLRRVFGSLTKLYYSYPVVSDEKNPAEVTKRSDNGSNTVRPRPETPTANPFVQHQPQSDVDSQLNPRYTFANYCGSMSNKIARSIGEAIATNPNCKTFNPLFVFGPTGVGKTHLIQAIGIRIKETNPQSRVLYVTARLFESQYTAAVSRGMVNEFINFYQSIDVLILDDIQDLMKKPSTQNTFFHIFNHLHQNQKQLILSSDTRPSALEGMEERLLSRFKWGMTAELEKPDLELRKDVLQLKAEQDGLDIPIDVLEFIAEHVTDSIRELEGIIVSLVAHATVLGRDVTLDLARQVLANAVKINRRQVNFEMIASEVSSYYDLDTECIFAKSRKREISDARQMVMYLAKKIGKMPLTAIGARLNRSHATVLHACKNIEGRLPHESKLQADVAAIEKALNA